MPARLFIVTQYKLRLNFGQCRIFARFLKQQRFKHKQKRPDTKPGRIKQILINLLLDLCVVILESLDLKVTLLGSLDAFSASLGSSHCRDVRNVLADGVLTDVRVIV